MNMSMAQVDGVGAPMEELVFVSEKYNWHGGFMDYVQFNSVQFIIPFHYPLPPIHSSSTPQTNLI